MTSRIVSITSARSLLTLSFIVLFACQTDDGPSLDDESEDATNGESDTNNGHDDDAEHGDDDDAGDGATGEDGGAEGGEGSGGGGDDGDDAEDGADDHGDSGGGDSGGGESGDGGDTGTDNEDTGTDDGDTGTDTDTTTDPPVCDAETPVVLFLSPDDSNSVSSPIQIRESVLSMWNSLSAVAIRPWEFFNYYSFPYPAAAAGEINVTTELYQSLGDPSDEYVLQIAVSSEEVSNASRPDLNLTFVLDTSGSMAGLPMDMLKESIRVMASHLREGDMVSMVTWNTSNALILGGHAVSGPNDATLLEKVDDLAAGGGTNLHAGLVAGYEQAMAAHSNDKINRVVLISDGGANVGITDAEIIAEHAGNQGEDGIYLVGVGVGSASSYHDKLMDQVTDVGKGASVFVPTAQEAQKIFGEQFINTLAVAARDVQVKLDLPPGFEIVRFGGEEYSDDPTEIEPQHLAPNDAMVFHQRIRTCAPELVDDQATIGVVVQYKNATTFELETVEHSTTFTQLLGQETPLLRKGMAVLGYTEALTAVQENEDAEAKVAEAKSLVSAAAALLPGDEDLAEMQAVLEALPY